MLTDLKTIPTVFVTSDGPQPMTLGERSAPPSRRTILRAVVAGSAVVGGNILGLVAQGMTSASRAETSPDGRLGWNDCHVGYTPDPDTSGAFKDWAAACNGGSYRSSVYCNGAGWHRRDTIYPEPGMVVDYDSVNNRCWGGSDSRNAWRWEARKDPDTPLRTFRCSDGRMTISAASTNTYNTVCRALV